MSRTRRRTIRTTCRRIGAIAMSANTTGLGRAAPGAAGAPDRNGPGAGRHETRRAHVVPAGPAGAGAGDARGARQEDGTVCRHGRKPRLPHRPPDRPPEGDRRVREHHLHRVRRQRRRGHRSVQDDRRHAGHARLPVRRDQLVADASQRLGRSGLLRRLRSDVGAGIDDAVQPVQGLARRGRHPQRADRQRTGRPAAQGQHRPRPDARRRHHANAARGRRRQLSAQTRVDTSCRR